MKIIGIIENNFITGIVYGLIEIPDPQQMFIPKGSRYDDIKRAMNKAQQLRQKQFTTKQRNNIRHK